MAIIVKPNTFVPGTVIRSAEVNADFDTIYNDYNGNIRSVNIHLSNGKILIGDPFNQAIESDLSSAPLSGFTPGSVLFAGPATTIAQDNANFFWNDTNNSLGIGTSSPASPTKLHINTSSGDAVLRITSPIGATSAIQTGTASRGGVFGWNDLLSEVLINYDQPFGTINTTLARFKTNGEMLLQAIDPPTANFSNSNSFIKAWGYIDLAANILSSFNISSASIVGGGHYRVNLTTAFSSINYVVSCTPASTLTTLGVIINTPSQFDVFTTNNLNANVSSGFYFIATGTQ